jgi:hypothetical protein
MQRRLELDVGATMDSVQKECMDDLAAAASALQVAVTTVVAAAEQPARRQLTQRLVAVCFEAVSAMLGALLRWAWAQQQRAYAASAYAWCWPPTFRS